MVILWFMLSLSCWSLPFWIGESKDPGFNMGQLCERLSCYHDDEIISQKDVRKIPPGFCYCLKR